MSKGVHDDGWEDGRMPFTDLCPPEGVTLVDTEGDKASHVPQEVKVEPRTNKR